MEKTVISVIVPIYNTAEYLEKCLKSIASQTYGQFQIVLIDDGSTDGSGQLCDEFAAKDMRIKVIHQKNKGLVNARKAGLREAEGEYIYYVDSDDWLDKNIIEVFMKIIMDWGADIISVGIKREYGSKVQIDAVPFEDGFYDKKAIKKKIIPELINTDKFFEWGQHLTYWHYLIKKELLQQNQIKVNDKIHNAEDVVCVFPCILDANSMFIYSRVYYHYRQRSHSMKWEEREREYENLQLVSHTLVERFSTEKEKNSLLKKVKYLILFELLTSVPSSILFKNGTFPYQYFSRDSKVVVYGAGLFGSKVMCALQEKEYRNIIAWIDSNYASCHVEGYEIQSPEALKVLEYDYVIIAVIRADIRDNILKYLLCSGVEREKIVDFDLKKIDAVSLPNEFGVD